MDKIIQERLKAQHYALVGKHSGIQICRWAKKAILDEGCCYKEKFYGIKSHRCCQMSPAVMNCPNSCVHCWRAIEYNLGDKIKGKINSPKEIIDEAIKMQRKMLSGFGGNNKINKKKLEEAQNPSQFAISLSGEPTIYPYLGELIEELRKRRITSFLVTNGLYPEVLEKLGKKKQLPTQLYISLNSPNKELYEEWHKSKYQDAWERFNKSLDIMSKLKTRRVLRMTLVKEKNMILPEEYAKLIQKANPDFIEIKGYMSVGFARKRLGYERMPRHELVKKFAKEILKYLKGYKLLDEKEESSVVLLGKSKRSMKIKKI